MTTDAKTWTAPVPALPVKDLLATVRAAQREKISQEELHEHLHDVFALVEFALDELEKRDGLLTAKGKELEQKSAGLVAAERDLEVRQRAAGIVELLGTKRRGVLARLFPNN